MPSWTKEQLDAINESGQNIIVSAGAGSGKTAVLTERVITKLKQGVKINELLILTFTNAAASEMKERIRKSIEKYPELKDNLEYLDSAYITTFDSFTLSLVKKYNYILNVSPTLSIIDQGIINNVKEDILDDVFLELYGEENALFQKLLDDFAIKNDTQIKRAILSIIQNLELKSDLSNYLENYLDNFLSDQKIEEYLKEYENILNNLLEEITDNIMFINDSFSDYGASLVTNFDRLLKSSGYDEIKKNFQNLSVLRRPKNTEEIKEYKDNIDTLLKELKGYLRFKSRIDIQNSLVMSKSYIQIIIEIIKRFQKKVWDYKFQSDLYEFTDISLMAIKLLKENSDILEEVKNSFREICVDEYQDTSDLQEEFISLIQNNNVYMVGDIKQSIYRFRNANPSIFKNKYDRYSQNRGGLKIDLLKNFRSRKSVLKSINEIFKYVMDDYIGGCDYLNYHQMQFGNLSFEENFSGKFSYETEIYNYNFDNSKYSQEEIEAFVIGRDILKKIQNQYEVVDKETNRLRPCRFEDFCIIMDRETAFLKYKQIFEYLQVPLLIFEDKKLTNELDIILLNNLVGLILKVKNKKIDQEFKYYLFSILRSNLFEYSDNAIFQIFLQEDFQNTEVYQICLEIALVSDTLSNEELLQMILDKFNYYENLIKVGNVEDSLVRIHNLLEIAENLTKMGYTIEGFKEYLGRMIESKNEITYKGNMSNSKSVKIMNIHKSKGLEFPICYFSGLFKEFNTMDIKKRFLYDNTYGIITPYFEEGIGSTILKDLVKNKYTLENISEEIRLFYVALTRVKEKMIIVASLNEENNIKTRVVDHQKRIKYNSFLSILNSIKGNLTPYITNINLNDYNITKDYLNNPLDNNMEVNDIEDLIQYQKINIINEDIINKHASTTITKIIDNDEYNLLKMGTLAHKYFEQTDFLENPPGLYQEEIKYLKEELKITNHTKIYKEYEFIYTEDNINYHGIIDLLLVEDNMIKIVDYKFKNINNPKYHEQLKVYANYLKTIFNKEIKLYLFSIMDKHLEEITLNELVTS